MIVDTTNNYNLINLLQRYTLRGYDLKRYGVWGDGVTIFYLTNTCFNVYD